MTLYEKYFLPKLLDCCCGMEGFQKKRAQVIPRAYGRVLEIGIGSGLNFNFPDTATYYQNGLNLIKTGIFTSDLHMPLYPLILALTKNSIATVYLDVFLSLLLSFLIYLLALKFTLSNLIFKITSFS